MTKNQPLVTVIIPCYNTETFVAETIESCLNSSYTPLEILVVDDGSTDNSVQIIKDIASKNSTVSYIYQENKGLSGARNTGIANAKGDFIMFLDADDLIYAKKIELQVSFLQDNPQYDLVACGFARTDERGEILYNIFANQRAIQLSEILISSQFPVHTALVRRSAIVNIGYFDTKLRAAEDWDYWCRMAMKNHKMYLLAQPLCTYRLLDDAMTANAPRQTKMLLQVVQKNFSNPDLPTNLKYLEAEAKKQVLLTGAARCFVLNYMSEGKEFLKKYKKVENTLDLFLLTKKIAAMMKHNHVQDIEQKAKKLASEIGIKADIEAHILLQYYLFYQRDILRLLSLSLQNPILVFLLFQSFMSKKR